MTSPTLASGGTQSGPGEERGDQWGLAGVALWSELYLTGQMFHPLSDSSELEVGQELLARPHCCAQVEAVGVARTLWWGLRP